MVNQTACSLNRIADQASLYRPLSLRQTYTAHCPGHLLINEHSTAEQKVLSSNPSALLISIFFFIFNSNKKKMMYENPCKNHNNCSENREPYYFIIICKCKQVPLRLFSYQMLASTLTMNEQSIYYKVYDSQSDDTNGTLQLAVHQTGTPPTERTIITVSYSCKSVNILSWAMACCNGKFVWFVQNFLRYLISLYYFFSNLKMFSDTTHC